MMTVSRCVLICAAGGLSAAGLYEVFQVWPLALLAYPGALLALVPMVLKGCRGISLADIELELQALDEMAARGRQPAVVILRN